LTAVDVAIDVGFVLLVPVVDALAFADDFGKGMLWLACEDMLGGDFSVGNNARGKFLRNTSKDHQVA